MTDNKEVLKLKHEILEILNSNNKEKCTFHFNESKKYPNINLILELTSYNPQKDVEFLIHKTKGNSEKMAYKKILEYVKKSSENKNHSYTIEWTWRKNGAKRQTSYFYASGPKEALNKFFHSVKEDEVIFYGMEKNPMA